MSNKIIKAKAPGNQKTLFSFFSKSSESKATTEDKDTKDSQSTVDKPTIRAVTTEPTLNSPIADITEDNTDEEINLTISTPANETDRSSQLTKKSKPKRAVVIDDEEEWDDEMSISSGGSDALESLEDSLEDSDSEDASENCKKRLRKKSSRNLPNKKSVRITDTELPTSNSANSKQQQKTPQRTPITATPSAGSSGKKSDLTITPSTSKKISSIPLLQLPPDTPDDSESPLNTSTLSEKEVGDGCMGAGSHEHNTWVFYTRSRRDKAGHVPGDEGYNPRTMHVPGSFIKDQTPAMKQWMEFKCENMDTVLFFKVGKFYELYHMDADVGVKELDLIYMKGGKAHSGFPEVSFGKYSNILVNRGYKVARIEQTETPDMMKERNKTATKGNKSSVVSREVCAIISKGTRTFSHMDDLSGLDSAATGASDSLLLCLTERSVSYDTTGDSEAVVEFGVCLVDSILGKVTLAQFEDDSQRSRLRTLLCTYRPTEVVTEFGKSSDETAGAIRLIVPQAARDVLQPETEMVSPEDTKDILQQGHYFAPPEAAEDGPMPEVLQMVVDGVADGSSALVIHALGGALWVLKRALIDYEILSMGRFYSYAPPDDPRKDTVATSNADDWVDPDRILTTSDSASPSSETDTGLDKEDFVSDNREQKMVLDSVALANLEILVRSCDQSEKGSLWAFINHCRTAFGRRLLQQWLCHPLCQPKAIDRRASAVDELLGPLHGEVESSRALLKGVPDLERLLSRVNANGIKKTALNHPDSRAIMFEDSIYSGRKIKDFADILIGFESLLKVCETFQKVTVTSPLLKTVVKASGNGGVFPYQKMAELLRYNRDVFDEKQARRDGVIKPKPGVNSDYDEAKQLVADIEIDMENYLKEQKRITGITDLKYFGANKDRFQLEVPMSQVNRVPGKWFTKGQKKTHRRYYTTFIEEKIEELVRAETRVVDAQKDTLRKIFEKFAESRSVWSSGVACISLLDALMSLAVVSASPGYVRATVTPRDSRGPFLNIEQGRHPMLEHILSSKDGSEYIPNSVTLGGFLEKPGSAFAGIDSGDTTSKSMTEEMLARMILLSGPNMGGKSTLLRQTCLIVVLAQLGCRVPAAKCCLTPVDRIFTRVGASDRILSGHSTFFVELSETAAVLKFATVDSLCILDELGRGTATFDGTAIAHAVVDHLVSHTRCRALFATHYHSLIDDWSIDPRVRLGHMDCLVEQAEQQIEMGTCMEMDDSGGNTSELSSRMMADKEEEVTFLYHLCDGSCPKSYGINVAKLAALPEDVIQRAMTKSRAFEEQMVEKERFGTLNTLPAVMTTTNELIATEDRLVIQQFYEKLSSVSKSELSDWELECITKELWNRCKHLLPKLLV